VDQIFFLRLFSPQWPIAWMQLLVVIFSICCHEYAHARVALFFGDDTAASRGHLTLNPLRQMGQWSLIMLLFLGLAWGQVPVNPAKLRTRCNAALTALAGPACNLLLFLGFAVAATMVYAVGRPGDDPVAYYGLTFCFLGAVMNMLLCLFNLLPVPGLDGFMALLPYLPPGKYLTSEFARGAMLLLVVLLFLNVDYVFRAAQAITLWGFQLLQGLLP